MGTGLDVYRDWLKITEPDRPLDHYQLLRLKRFEDDPQKIRANYRKLNAHVRKFASGEYEAESQALLNELAKAMLCLTDAERKDEYDSSLGRGRHAELKQLGLEELLVKQAKLTREQLAEAKKYAEAVGMSLHQAAVQKKMVSSAVAMQVFAESQGIPFLDLADVNVDEELLAKIPAVTARQHSCVPVIVDEGCLLIAAPHLLNQDIEDELSLRLSMPVRRLLCTPADVNRFIGLHYPREKAESELRARGTADRPPAKPPGKAALLWRKVVKWVKENSTRK